MVPEDGWMRWHLIIDVMLCRSSAVSGAGNTGSGNCSTEWPLRRRVDVLNAFRMSMGMASTTVFEAAKLAIEKIPVAHPDTGMANSRFPSEVT